MIVHFDTEDDVAGLQIDLTFNPLDVSIAGDPSAGAGAANHDVSGSELAPGHYRVIIVSLGAEPVETGELFTLPIKFERTVAETSRAVSLGEVVISSKYGLNGSVSFSPFVSIQGVTEGMEVDPGQALPIEAVAFGFEDGLEEIEVLVNGRAIGVSTTAPFSTTWTPIEPGAVLVAAIGRGSGSTANSPPVSLKVTGDPLTDFNTWREFFFSGDQLADSAVSGVTGDADLDGDGNLFEFLSGGDPNRAEGGDALEHSMVEDGGKRYLALTVRRRVNMDNTVLSAVSSAALDFHETVPATPIRSQRVGDYELVTFRDTVPFTETARRFMRIQMDYNPPSAP